MVRPHPAWMSTGQASAPDRCAPSARRAGLARRLAAAVYDLFLLAGIWFVAVLALLPFTGGQALDGHNLWFRAYLLFVPYLFFGWFWTHGGQTLGMKVWRMRVTTTAGVRLGWGRALLRYAGAWLAWLSVIGLLWCVIDKRGRAWQDLLSGTELVVNANAAARKK